MAQYALTKSTLFMYGLNSQHGQFPGSHFLAAVLKAFLVVNFFVSSGTMFQIWGPKVWNTFYDKKTTRNIFLGKTNSNRYHEM